MKKQIASVKQLIEYLKTFEQDLPVYIGVWYDRTPFDGDGTDMSCYEPHVLTENMIKPRTTNVGMDKSVWEPHVYIEGNEYL